MFRVKRLIMKNFTFLFVLVSFTGFCQTRLISHKSHSGSTATFTTALKNNLFDSDASNFGVAPIRTVKTAQLDSVIFISHDKAVMVTSEYCHTEDMRGRAKEDNEKAERTLWKAGRDTVYNHPLFSRNHSLDSIRSVLKNDYFFKNDIDNTVFIGYDNKTKKYEREEKKRKKSTFYVGRTGNDNFPSKPMLVFILALLSAVFGCMLYLIYKTRGSRTATL